jgi:hypothetical protein
VLRVSTAHDDATEAQPEDRSWNTSPLHDVPVGPDMAGDAVFAAANGFVAGWRAVRRWATSAWARVSRRAGA